MSETTGPRNQSLEFKSNPALERLGVLVGEWQMESPQYPEASGRAMFEWLEGGAFLVMRDHGKNEPFPSAIMVIGPDEVLETYSVVYYDSRGVSRVYQMSLANSAWKMWREAPGFWQRFTGTISADGQTIQSAWEKSTDGAHWEHDFDLIYTKPDHE